MDEGLLARGWGATPKGGWAEGQMGVGTRNDAGCSNRSKALN